MADDWSFADEWGFGEQPVKARVRMPEAKSVSAEGERKAKALKPKERTLWRRFVDSIEEGAVNSEIGVNAIERADLANNGWTREQIDAREREKRARLGAASQEDERAFRDVDTLSPANIGRRATELVGNIIGGVDPTYLLNPGKSVLQKMGAQGAINAGVDVVNQGIQKQRGMRDEWNWDQTALSGAGGVVLGGLGGRRSPARGPVNPVEGRVTSPFGQRRQPKAGASTDHLGADIAAREGTPVKASADGVVTKVGRNHNKRGNWVEVDYGGGVTSRYLHLSGFNVKPGDQVGANAAFARTGKTGNVTGPHLHWSTQVDGKAVDPFKVKYAGRQAEDVLELRNEGVPPIDPADLARMMRDNDAAYAGKQDLDELNDLADSVADEPDFRINEKVNDLDPILTQIEKDATEARDLFQAGVIGQRDFDARMTDLEKRMDGIETEGPDRVSLFPTDRDGFAYDPERNIDEDLAPFMRTEPDMTNVESLGKRRVDAEAEKRRAEDDEDVQRVTDSYWDARNIVDQFEKGIPANFDLKKAREVYGDMQAAERWLRSRGNTKAVEVQRDLMKEWEKVLLRLGDGAKKNDADKVVGKSSRTGAVNDRGEAGEAPVASFRDKNDGIVTDGRGRAERSTVPNTREPYPPTRDPANDIGGEALPGVRQDMGNAKEGNDNVPSKKKGPLQTIKDIIDDEEGAFRPYGRKRYGDDGPSGPDGEGPNASNPAVQKLREALKAALPKSREQRKSISEERSRRLAKVAAAQRVSGGRLGYYAELAQLKGEMAKVDFESLEGKLSDDEVDELFDLIKNHKPGTIFDSLNARKGLEKLLGQHGGRVPTLNELRLLGEVFPKDVIDGLKGQRTLGDKVKNVLVNALNLPRSLMASFDLSAPFRQGLFMIGRKEFYSAFAQMFKVYGSKRAHDALMMEIKSRPSYGAMQRARLALTDVDGALNMREEDFMSDWAPRIPVVGAFVRASTRAYSGFLNRLRADVFDDLYTKSKDAGVNFYRDPKALTDIAKYVNAATGRGSMGKRINAAAPILSALLFSPRLMAARITMLNPVTYVKLSPVVRKEAVKDLVKFGSIAGTVLTLGAAGGLDVSTDLRSSDGLKMKMGNTRFDVLGGFQQYLKLGTQLATGQKIDAKGRLVELGEGSASKNRLNVVEDFFYSKGSPVTTFVADAARGRDIVGNEFSLPEAIIKRFIPLFMQDVEEAVKEYGPKGAATAVPAIFGVGVQTYAPKEKKEKEVNEDEWKF